MKRQFWFVLIIPLIFTFCSSGGTVAVEEELAEVQQPVEGGFQLSAALFDSYVDVQEALRQKLSQRESLVVMSAPSPDPQAHVSEFSINELNVFCS